LQEGEEKLLGVGEVIGWSCREECREVNGGTTTGRSWQLALVVGGEEHYG